MELNDSPEIPDAAEGEGGRGIRHPPSGENNDTTTTTTTTTNDAGSFPRFGKGFFSQSQLSVQALPRCLYTSVCNRMHLHLCVR